MRVIGENPLPARLELGGRRREADVLKEPRPRCSRAGTGPRGLSGGAPDQILHSRADDVVPSENSVELLANSGLPECALIEVGQDHRLADQEPLEAFLRAVEARFEPS